MKRFFYLSAFVSLLLTVLVSCGSDGEPTGPLPDPDDGFIDLSAEEMANCYIVREAGSYKFKADNQFNLGEGLPVPPEIHPTDAKLVWQTEPGTITNVELADYDGMPYIVFNVAKVHGNALLAATNDNDEILWSWHIWMPEESPEAILTATGYYVMNMNLGAGNSQPGDPLSYGLLYQWGRKDPLPAAATLTGDATTTGTPLYDIEGNPVTIVNSSWYSNSDNTLAFATANPTTCISNYSQFAKSRDWLKDSASDDSLWGNPEGYYRDSENNSYPNKGRKTCYDPSPAGWMVAPPDAFRNATFSGGYAWTFLDFNICDINHDGNLDIDDYKYGWSFPAADGSPIYFPGAARYDGSYAMLMGSVSGYWGNYWSNSPSNSMTGGALSNLSFQTKDMNGNDMTTISPMASGSKADAYSIRCVKTF